MKSEWVTNMLKLLRIKRREEGPTAPVIDQGDKDKLVQAQRRAKRLEDIVVAYTGAELSAITGKDTK